VTDLRYDDGEQFHSPSSFVRTLRSRRTGKLGWVGYISPVPPQGNPPRHPLVIAEIDEEHHGLRRHTVATIDDFDPAAAPEPNLTELQLANFAMLENRKTNDFGILTTRYWRPTDRNAWLGGVYRYVLSLTDQAEHKARRSGD